MEDAARFFDDLMKAVKQAARYAELINRLGKSDPGVGGRKAEVKPVAGNSQPSEPEASELSENGETTQRRPRSSTRLRSRCASEEIAF
jgi:hypothetical protein